MKLSVTMSGNACGADIKFDLSLQLYDRTFAEIEQTFHDNIVVYFRGQHPRDEPHIEFSRRFGQLEIQVRKKYLLPNYPQMLLISNIKDENVENIGLADPGIYLAAGCFVFEKAQFVLGPVSQASSRPPR